MVHNNQAIQSLETGTLSPPNGKTRRLIVIVWLFVAIVVLTLGLTYYSIGLLSAARAYVAGEGLWSKAQKDMVYTLARYVRYREEEFYQAYRSSLSVILGDRQARLELEKENPDLQVAYAGFLQGRNHPDDIPGMIGLFRNFRHVPDLAKAIDIWGRADAEVNKLVLIAERVRAEGHTTKLTDANVALLLDEVYQISQRLMPLEDEFSYTLGAATRKAQAVLLFVMFALVLALLALACLFSRRLMRENESVQSALREGEKQLRDLMQFAPLPIVIVRLEDEAVLYANDHALKQFKISPASLQLLKASSFYIQQMDRAQFVAGLRQHGHLSDWEVRLQDTEGTPFWAQISSQIISYQRQDCVFTALSNINERKRFQAELQHRVFHDELTGLPNRAMFMDIFNKLLAQTPHSSHKVFAVLFIDLDRFKIINDDLGHHVGDKLLQQVAQRLKASVRSCDIVSRLGGDEFVVLIQEQAETELIIRLANEICQAMERCYQLGDAQVNITTSIGISCYPRDGTDCLTLLKNADVAMYRAKERGRNNFQFYSGPHGQ